MTDQGRTTYFEQVAALADLVAEHAAWADAQRRPAPAMLRAAARAGLLRLLAPRAYGGDEIDLATFIRVVEEMSALDGSAGWTLMTTNEELGIASAYLPPGTVASLLATQPDVIVAGSGIPAGSAVRARGGWRVSGRWQFVTAGPVADHLVLCAIADGGNPRPFCYVLVPAEQAAILDTWQVAGLAGTGSHDVELRDVFVPDERVGVCPQGGPAVPELPYYRLAGGLRFPFPKVGVASGIARTAIREFQALAVAKTPVLTRTALADRPLAATAVAEAQVGWAAGRALVFQVLDEVWDVVKAGRPVPPELHARCRLACSYSVQQSVHAVDAVVAAAGTSSNFAAGTLQRCFRDVHAVPQHFMLAPYQMHSAGRVLLGLDPGDPAF